MQSGVEVLTTGAGDDAAETTNEERVIDAALRCLGRFGLAKTSLDDVAREAGMSRATLYRAFPGGKDVLFTAVVTREVAAFLAELEEEVAGVAEAEDLLTIGFASALRFIRTHVTLGTVLREEAPSALGPAFEESDPAYLLIRAFVADHLHPFVSDPVAVDHFVEVLVRLVLSFATQPSTWLRPDDEDSVRHFVRLHLTPALAG